MEAIVQQVKSFFPSKELVKDLNFVFVDNYQDFIELRKRYNFDEVKGEYLGVEYYTLYEGIELPVKLAAGKFKLLPKSIRLLPDPRLTTSEGRKSRRSKQILKINRELEKGTRQVYQREALKEFEYRPVQLTRDIPDHYMIYMIYQPTQEIIGDYSGILVETPNKQRCSRDSFIQIRLDFQGKGLCTVLASVTYCTLRQLLQVYCIRLNIVADNSRYACACYIKAAHLCGFRVYHQLKEIGVDRCFDQDFQPFDVVLLLVAKEFNLTPGGK